ncbi:MAG: hypothetical protein JXR76_18130 [Deltaproteobacteria bacterium]|nr:hypothetical protein [Deltaproteobacteria bacterium]
MKTRPTIFTLILTTALIFMGCEADDMVGKTGEVRALDLGSGVALNTTRAACHNRGLELVRLSGKVRYFGMNILQSPPVSYNFKGVSDVQVWLAEYPVSKLFNIRTDDDGHFEMFVVKQRGRDLNVSFMYEKDHFPSSVETMVFASELPAGWEKSLIKSNVYTVGSDDISDIAMQMPDELFLYYSKLMLEQSITSQVGIPYSIENLAVATVGKAWASIFNPTLPHGDAGATVVVDPPLATPPGGPIYFDETVTPNPLITSTSIDGGVLLNNLSIGAHNVTAVKEGVTYDTVQFVVEPGVKLYVASPPHSIQGSNTSGPGAP